MLLAFFGPFEIEFECGFEWKMCKKAHFEALLVKILIPVEPSIIWEIREISISGHFWPSVTGMICVRYAELCVYNMPGMLFVASVTSFEQKHGSGLHFGLGENRDFR